jgi:hypothetical protein
VAGALLCVGVGLALAAHLTGGQPLPHHGLAARALGANALGSAAAHEPHVTHAAAPVPVGCAHGRPPGEPRGCRTGHPPRTSELTGDWVRTGVTGVWRGLEGREVMRFGPGGDFSWGLVGPYRTVRGRYVLSGGTVTVTALPTSLCHPGDRYAWWATVTRARRLHLDHVAGTEQDGCTSAPRVWSGRRLRVAGRAPPE